MREQGGDGVGGGRHVGVAEHDEHGGRGDRDQPHGRAEQRARRCPRCRPAPWPGRCPSRAAGAPGSSRRPAGRTGPARSAGCRGARGRARRDRGRRPARPHRSAPRTVGPVPSTTSSASTLSAVRPYATARGPHALLPIIPPSVARACVEGSGPNRRPCGAAAFCRLAITTPGSTRAVRASGSMSRIRLHVPREVEHHPGPDRVARDRGPSAARGQRDAQRRG